jgi:hypothetical protein
MTPQAELARDLYTNLVAQLYDVPPPRRARSSWVMNQDWLNECRKIGDYPPSPRAMLPTFAQEIMLGLPVYVTEDGGFPHLIAD